MMPNEVAVAAMMISNVLSPCTSGVGASLGTYPPECVMLLQNSMHNDFYLATSKFAQAIQ